MTSVSHRARPADCQKTQAKYLIGERNNYYESSTPYCQQIPHHFPTMGLESPYISLRCNHRWWIAGFLCGLKGAREEDTGRGRGELTKCNIVMHLVAVVGRTETVLRAGNPGEDLQTTLLGEERMD
ncbi:hypothetical protein AAY473_017425 [Plecturocebus cupreus]